ncbi:MAG: hypothetical protein ACWA42_03835 [Lutibacter sp.]
MKNSKSKKFNVLLLALAILLVSNLNASNSIFYKNNHLLNSEFTIDPIYNQLFKALKNGKCYNVKVTAVSVKNNNYAFTSFSQGFLHIVSGYNIEIKSLRTEFDDRNNFQGAKTIENLVIYKKDKYHIGMTVNMKNWGNKTIKLKDVKIAKEPYGYFITGKATDGNRTVYYTLGIYQTNCLI